VKHRVIVWVAFAKHPYENFFFDGQLREGYAYRQQEIKVEMTTTVGELKNTYGTEFCTLPDATKCGVFEINEEEEGNLSLVVAEIEL